MQNAVIPSFLVMIVQLDFMVNINYLDFTRPYDRYKGVSFDILPPTDPNHLVSFDYQQGFSAIFVSIPCFLPRDKVHDFFNRADYILLPSFTNGRRNVRTKLRQKNRGRLI